MSNVKMQPNEFQSCDRDEDKEHAREEARKRIQTMRYRRLNEPDFILFETNFGFGFYYNFSRRRIFFLLFRRATQKPKL